ncbi:hypothetical protein [Pedobacter sp. SYSU D00535]|uniref:hypothetical protein n=1 Tax=Pedobacter sp. SYSU D00535 TaxID=2810308 RepID=UPI001A971733|nr:hypothetical protein [Pedobacter sp. SYSU D00535]
MKKASTIILVCLFLMLNRGFAQFASAGMSNTVSPFEGEWEWEDNDLEHNFVLKIIRSGNYLKGSYCSVMKKGLKIDCAEENAISFAGPIPATTTFIVPFKSAFSELTGKLQLTFDGFNILWEILEQPRGEFYVPKQAILIKDRNNSPN